MKFKLLVIMIIFSSCFSTKTNQILRFNQENKKDLETILNLSLELSKSIKDSHYIITKTSFPNRNIWFKYKFDDLTMNTITFSYKKLEVKSNESIDYNSFDSEFKENLISLFKLIKKYNKIHSILSRHNEIFISFGNANEFDQPNHEIGLLHKIIEKKTGELFVIHKTVVN